MSRPVIGGCSGIHSLRRVASLACATALAWATALLACTPPSESGSWECIAPANPGGGWDLTCRTVAQALEQSGVAPGRVRVSNMPGAGGAIGYAHAVTDRAGDGGLLVGASPATTLRLAQRQYGHLTEDDVRWLAAVGTDYGAIAVSSDSPWRTLNDLIEGWRADPASIIVTGVSAVAGQDHMKILLLAREAGLDPRQIRYVPFDGGGEALAALLGGFVHVLPAEAAEMEGQVEAGTVRVLTILADERVDGVLADVPTARELGYDVEWVTWRGLFVPPGLQDEEYQRWVEIFRDLSISEEWEQARRASRLRPFFMAGDEFEGFVRNQVRDFRALSREIGLIP